MSNENTVLLDMTEKLKELVVRSAVGRESVLTGVTITDLHMPPQAVRVGGGRRVILSLLADLVETRDTPDDEPIPYQVTPAGRVALAEHETETTIANLQDQLATAIAINTALHKLLQSCQGVDPEAENARVQFLRSKESLSELWTALGAVLSQTVEATDEELFELTELSSERWLALPDTIRAVHAVVDNIEDHERERELEIIANNSAAAASE